MLEYENAIPGFTIEVRSERSTETGDLLFRYFINNRPGVAYTTLEIAIRQGVKRLCLNAGIDLKYDVSILTLVEINNFLEMLSAYLKKSGELQ
jgi:hypothetical protein